MNISWLGQSAIKIEFKTAQSEGTLLIDPYEHKNESMPRSMSADLALLTRGEKNVVTLSKQPYLIDEAGEYEFKEVLVYGFQTALVKNAPLVFRLEVEHVTIAHVGLASAWLDEKIINELQGVDVLMIPVGGAGAMTHERAVDLVTKLEPRIVIPYAFRADGTGEEYAEAKPFLKALGQTVEPQPKFKLSKKDLPSDTLQVVLLEKQ
ncbi:MAG: hypothetical protein A2848_00045 [Candidatus Magasanikbacteria bacterium RIFCSPHIGHO2_01_FULL_50_8]|uniref:Zn-dependent hydrolase n=1 Tax=Candidatus Magasanikbacteria bacterium RIFCSPHIGHO2_01_FULL_50_8 TaxID=1798674 RepID=A0A1F6LNH3_9BACT|nr:MAG: hypothetical protein A2848_00045 [Candidatus Magasanikbacteria bacterium RIFCSPHIGHO2_01_FULL_50_8]